MPIAPAARPATLAISVVVPTRAREQLLARCLTSLLAQDIGAGRFEILVVDDAPSAATRATVMDCAQGAPHGPALRYLPNRGRHGPAAARNRGWRAARAPIVAFTDDDTVPAPDWLRH